MNWRCHQGGRRAGGWGGGEQSDTIKFHFASEYVCARQREMYV